jgi:uncharacterized protein YbjT (DUF2867 family)
MTRKTYVVTGATGHIGGIVADRLEAAGHEVRRVSRRTGVDLGDAAALGRAFAGADRAFLLIPPELTDANLRRRQNELGEQLAQAAKAAGIRRVLFISSVNAQYAEGTGPILGLHDMERRLDSMGFPELIHLRPCFFMENHLWGLPLIAQHGIYGTAFSTDAPLPMIATADIAEEAARILLEEPFGQRHTRELLGPREYTMAEATRILGAAIGKPGLKYVQFPYEDARKAMIGNGLSPSYADAMMQIARSFNEGKIGPEEKRTAGNTTPTTLEQFARDVFRPAHESTAAGSAHGHAQSGTA